MRHFPLWKPVYDRRRCDAAIPDRWVEQNTGIACMLLAGHIINALDDEQLVQERKKDKERLDNQKVTPCNLQVRNEAFSQNPGVNCSGALRFY
jgi:hypothetical protein